MAVDKLRSSACAELAAEYARRSSRFARFETKEVRGGGGSNAEETRQREGERLLGAIEPADTVVVCDERGRQKSSEELAAFLGKRMSQGGAGRLVFVIGGGEGLSDAVRARAAEVLSLSRMTLSHELARVVMMEQIYRALTILANHPYHRA
ncbi:MAG TPA: 23S rRNA (pseudouridine(1915)-N(3))-methyltransferase RlmH [Candidatus Brocadiia bacterium]|nr:23S rRNA (pseudouridine(1915)-N(3))-methyltransferase RlmH [Candidatus Brocadiia bacterium]